MINIYRRFWQINWAEQWQYRANLMMYLLYWLVSPIVYLSVWTAVANSQGSVQGLTANDFQTYYMTLLVVDVLTSNTIIYSLAWRIQGGTLSGDLLLPVHPVLTGILMGNIAFKALTLIALVPIWLGLYPPLCSVSLSASSSTPRSRAWRSGRRASFRSASSSPRLPSSFRASSCRSA
jgi:ABC-2 type transport system permease protein